MIVNPIGYDYSQQYATVPQSSSSNVVTSPPGFVYIYIYIIHTTNRLKKRYGAAEESSSSNQPPQQSSNAANATPNVNQYTQQQYYNAAYFQQQSDNFPTSAPTAPVQYMGQGYANQAYTQGYPNYYSAQQYGFNAPRGGGYPQSFAQPMYANAPFNNQGGFQQQAQSEKNAPPGYGVGRLA